LPRGHAVIAFVDVGTGEQNIVKEIKQHQKSGYNMYRGWTQTDYQNKHYNINQKDEGT